MGIPDTLACVECGGPAYRIGYLPPDEPPEPGDIVAYRCGDCDERMDVEVTAADLEGAEAPWTPPLP